MYAVVDKDKIVSYPAYPDRDNPHISFPNNWTGGSVDGRTYVVVEPTPRPEVGMGWSTLEAPPRLVDGRWFQDWTITVQPKDSLKNAVTNMRYDAEIGGVVVDGVAYETDRDSQNKLHGVLLDAVVSNSFDYSVNWKCADDTFVTLSANQVFTVAKAVRAHVQRCYDTELYYHNLIDNSDTDALSKIDFSVGWDGQEAVSVNKKRAKKAKAADDTQK